MPCTVSWHDQSSAIYALDTGEGKNQIGKAAGESRPDIPDSLNDPSAEIGPPILSDATGLVSLQTPVGTLMRLQHRCILWGTRWHRPLAIHPELIMQPHSIWRDTRWPATSAWAAGHAPRGSADDATSCQTDRGNFASSTMGQPVILEGE